jgi:hypothetical protein
MLKNMIDRVSRLFTSRFQHHTFGYKAPTIILFETSDGYLFCLSCDEEFRYEMKENKCSHTIVHHLFHRESPKHFGGIQTSLLQLKPVFKVVLGNIHSIF